MSNDFRETLYTIDKKGNRQWVYPSEIQGFFRNKRKLVAYFLILIYCVLPWLEFSGTQAVLFDITHRKFIFFGQTFWATDSKFLLLTLLSLAFSLFFFTAVFGRIWCGWACPETVFLEFIFRPIEILIEGSAAARKKLDQQKMNLQKFRIKTIKWMSFSVIAWFLSSTVLAYFFGKEQLLRMMFDYPWNNWSVFMLTLFLMLLLLFQFGWFREQFCTVLCPYARFQSVLLDDRSLLVGYDYTRGEPRGKAKQSGNGDCVDCGLCVRVCPTGIDIRNGLQLECIQCAQCVDACNSIMSKLERPLGLIRYDTEKGLKGEKLSFIRPRIIVYALILALVFSSLGYLVLNREYSTVQLLHASKNNLYSIKGNQQIENVLQLKIENKSDKLINYKVSTLNPNLQLTVPIDPFPVAAFSHAILPIFVSAPQGDFIAGKFSSIFVISNDAGLKKELKIEIIGPG